MMMRNDGTPGAPGEFRTMQSIYSCRAFRRKLEKEEISQRRDMKVFRVRDGGGGSARPDWLFRERRRRPFGEISSSPKW